MLRTQYFIYSSFLCAWIIEGEFLINEQEEQQSHDDEGEGMMME